jgi:hypothetical protein
MDKIKRVSLFFRVLFQIAFVITPIFLLIAWIYAPHQIHFLADIFVIDNVPQNYPILAPLPLSAKILGFFISLIPTGVTLFVLYFLIKLFKLYERGEIFLIENVRYIRNIGYTILIGQLLNPVYQALISADLTWVNHTVQKGMRFASISFDSTNINILLMSLFVILISWIMEEGCKLRDEQQLII